MTNSSYPYAFQPMFGVTQGVLEWLLENIGHQGNGWMRHGRDEILIADDHNATLFKLTFALVL
ncbi:hypothetical protein [Sphingobium sp. LSP13-1-1.1]|uniref:hypothetical protein n=1 Tax=Sphingobium sp. LSP13-1-1.1 TaxID=3135234 RepID=UPI00343FE8F1